MTDKINPIPPLRGKTAISKESKHQQFLQSKGLEDAWQKLLTPQRKTASTKSKESEV